MTHYPVFNQEIISYFKETVLKEAPFFLDATAGEGGHSELLLEAFPNSTLFLVDRDPVMLKRACERLRVYQHRVTPVLSNYSEIGEKKPELLGKVDGVLADLGVSMFHFQGANRGFSYTSEDYLDMRLDPSQDMDAFFVVNQYSEKNLADIFFQYGEERWSKRIASILVERREKSPIRTAKELADIVFVSIPVKFRYHSKIHPATRVFQAIRIEVNQELAHLEKGMRVLFDMLAESGVLSVISFHSLEDRIVKNFMKSESKKRTAELLTKKPLLPTEKELFENKASRSAKLRIVQKY
jgi:16S rRNA (cytosine1402-N4)-methyltransferase